MFLLHIVFMIFIPPTDVSRNPEMRNLPVTYISKHPHTSSCSNFYHSLAGLTADDAKNSWSGVPRKRNVG